MTYMFIQLSTSFITLVIIIYFFLFTDLHVGEYHWKPDTGLFLQVSLKELSRIFSYPEKIETFLAFTWVQCKMI